MRSPSLPTESLSCGACARALPPAPVTRLPRTANYAAQELAMSRCRLKEWYNLVVKPDLMAKMQYTNVHQIPKVNVVTVHITTKQAASGLDNAVPAAFMLELVTGQRAQLTRVKQANAMYKVRPGFLEGAKVHLRGEQMYDFMDRLTTQARRSASWSRRPHGRTSRRVTCTGAAAHHRLQRTQGQLL